MSSVDSSSPQPRPGAVQRLRGSFSHFLMIALVRDSWLSRAIRRPLWKGVYSVASRRFLPNAVTTFFNQGYLSDADELGAVDTPEIADRVCERLYDQVVSGVDLAGRAVVEVGCGSGSGSAYVARTHHPASLVGIDLNKDLIAWCREHHDATNLRFMQGDAQDLPITSNSVDAVINIESSHCYPSRVEFFKEIMRVLRPGGSFLYADFLFSAGDRLDVVNAEIGEVGLVIEDCIDITKNVLAARDAVSSSPAFRSGLRETVPARMLPMIEESFCLVDTKAYSRLASGEVLYLQWKVSKPNENSSSSDVLGALAG
jgi:ubiquinone/menaquinone biosynthesis C-methylase UbiE